MDSSRQMLLGIGVFLGGTVLLYAMFQQLEGADDTQADALETPYVLTQPNDSTSNTEALTADIDTETRILAEKRRARESRVAELDERAKDFLEEQERAELLAMEKARLENQKYRSNAIEPVIDEPVPNANLEDGNSKDGNAGESNSVTANDEDVWATVTKPIVISREVATEPTPKVKVSGANINNESTLSANQTSTQANINDTHKQKNTTDQRDLENNANKIAEVASTASKPKLSNNRQSYTVQRGDGLIKLARRYDVPLKALLEANGMNINTSLVVGKKVIIPSRQEVERFKRDPKTSTQASSGNSSSNTKASSNTETSAYKAPAKPVDDKAPARQLEYKVGRGDGLIKLAREYNVPVATLAQANDIKTNASLRVGQTLTIPSRKQVARLQREAEEKRRAEAAKREAQKRLKEARRKASNEGVSKTYGVQVALADNQQKADNVVKQMQAAGYKATTSKTSRGVRVIVGPEKGKDAALALKDKVNADSRVNVNGAWVLDWR